MEKHHAKAPSSRLRRPCHHRPRLRRRIAVVYFTKTGNTKSLAEAVRHMPGAALFRVETVEPYPESYGSATEIVKDELQRGVIRPIRPLAFNPDDYDVVVLATPTWRHHAAMPLQTWIRSVDLSAKKILTANTHGGGGLMHTREAFEALLAGRRLGTHLTVYGAVRPQDAKVRKTAVSDARNTITDRNPTWRGLNLPTV